MQFERRDLLLIFGVLFFALGILGMTGWPLIYAILISASIFVGVKLYMKKKTNKIFQDLGDGICADCGSKISKNKCDVCDSSSEK